MAEQRDPRSARRVPSHPLAKDKPTPKRPAGGPGRRPLPAGEQFFTPGATGLRKAVELRSAAPLVFLFGLPRWILPVVMVVLLLIGFAVPYWAGAVAVLPVIAFVGWLAYMSWPSLGAGGRLLRVALLTFLILVAADRFGAF
ncbi:hypothetical protein Misp01_37720 [Microtetraspora sp. NBRC 13810]|uniref:DUF6703 family protein n=1 Tax=Microtetraspora sp. NBRC 13810 TaxID=3030990 RepID=UPI0024A59318|nr:DUF6703 family protein [Microtetraspora sp. NBRC 13810]GLW08642.1 hypothetical protein Misp01_37720 [Microtetraspora sp. NBRC 13810]